MFEKFNQKTKKMLDDAILLSKQRGLTKIGTESLLLSMFNHEGSICRFLLSEYDIVDKDIITIMDSLIILRKKDELYSEKFLQILKTADAMALENEQYEISDEHLFFALLVVRDTIFLEIIERLGLNSQVLLEDLREIFEFSQEEDDLKNYTTNITQKAKNKELSPFIGRAEYLERLMVVLNRKNKNNPLLIGSAGVGKTAIVEGLAQYYIANNIDTEIISLNLASVLANTKYRGDFEGRIDKLTKSILNRKNAILFIDEIHTIMGAGASEGTLDAANILKPLLARNNFKCIGATTIEEYRKTIMSDKALNRRFQSIFVSEPNEFETTEILFGLKNDFEHYHQISIPDDLITYTVKMAKQKLINRRFPDKAIDILDEAMSFSKMHTKNALNNQDIDFAISQISGLKPVKVKEKYYFEELRPYFIDNILGIKQKPTLLTINYIGSGEEFQLLINEIIDGYGITDEMMLELDLINYKENFSISSLIGSPPGYVGYQEGGLLSEHIGKYPFSLVVIDHFNDSSIEVQNLFLNILKKGFFYDKKGRYVTCQNLVVIIKEEYQNKKTIGFFSEEKSEESELSKFYDLTIVGKKDDNIEKDIYQNAFALRGYQVLYNHNDFILNKNKFQEAFINLLSEYKKGTYRLNYNDFENRVLIEIQN